MNGFEEKVIDYVEKALSCKDISGNPRDDWAFVAIDFSHAVGLITEDKANELYEKYNIF